MNSMGYLRASSSMGPKKMRNRKKGNGLFPTCGLSKSFMDNELLGKLRSTNLVPQDFEEFKGFVRSLMSSPVHDVAVESVWKFLYSEGSNNTVTGAEILGEEKLKQNICGSVENAPYCSVKNQVCASQGQNEESSSESTSSSDIEVLECIIKNVKEQEDRSDSDASVEILDDHCAVHCSVAKRSAFSCHNCERVPVSSNDVRVCDQSGQDDIVILGEVHEKETRPELQKKKKKRIKLKKMKTEIRRIKTLLSNLLETSDTCVQNNISSQNLKELKDKKCMKEGKAFKNISNTSLSTVQKRRASDNDSCSSSPGASSSSSRRDKFMWHEVIVNTINSNPQKRISVDRLKKKVITRYMLHRGNISENTLRKFLKYLHTAPGVSVDNGCASIKVGR